MSEIKNGRLGLYCAEHLKCNHMMTLGSRGLNNFCFCRKVMYWSQSVGLSVCEEYYSEGSGKRCARYESTSIAAVVTWCNHCSYWSGLVPYMWNRIISQLFQPSSTFVWNSFMSARGILPEITSQAYCSSSIFSNTFIVTEIILKLFHCFISHVTMAQQQWTYRTNR